MALKKTHHTMYLYSGSYSGFRIQKFYITGTFFFLIACVVHSLVDLPYQEIFLFSFFSFWISCYIVCWTNFFGLPFVLFSLFVSLLFIRKAKEILFFNSFIEFLNFCFLVFMSSFALCSYFYSILFLFYGLFYSCFMDFLWMLPFPV